MSPPRWPRRRRLPRSPKPIAAAAGPAMPASEHRRRWRTRAGRRARRPMRSGRRTGGRTAPRRFARPRTASIQPWRGRSHAPLSADGPLSAATKPPRIRPAHTIGNDAEGEGQQAQHQRDVDPVPQRQIDVHRGRIGDRGCHGLDQDRRRVDRAPGRTQESEAGQTGRGRSTSEPADRRRACRRPGPGWSRLAAQERFERHHAGHGHHQGIAQHRRTGHQRRVPTPRRARLRISAPCR